MLTSALRRGQPMQVVPLLNFRRELRVAERRHTVQAAQWKGRARLLGLLLPQKLHVCFAREPSRETVTQVGIGGCFELQSSRKHADPAAERLLLKQLKKQDTPWTDRVSRERKYQNSYFSDYCHKVIAGYSPAVQRVGAGTF